MTTAAELVNQALAHEGATDLYTPEAKHLLTTMLTAPINEDIYADAPTDLNDIADGATAAAYLHANIGYAELEAFITDHPHYFQALIRVGVLTPVDEHPDVERIEESTPYVVTERDQYGEPIRDYVYDPTDVFFGRDDVEGLRDWQVWNHIAAVQVAAA